MELKLLWTIQLAPLAAFFGIQLMPKSMRRLAPLLAIACAFAAAAAALKLFAMNVHSHGAHVFEFRWLEVAPHQLWRHATIDRYELFAGFLVDPLNLLMIALVTTIALLVHVFSFYYMSEDASRARYFGFLSFFAFSMTGLVLSSNLLQTFMFWELVGLTSYLLIGFWYEKPSAATAARKAFVINRLGDLGFYLGVVLLFLLTGTLAFTALTPDGALAGLSPAVLTFLGLLVFTGVMGKSAQFPFHTWLPDAMEGPTPVSALIHSATMVAAGVFLLARAFGLFSASATTLSVVLAIGALTAFLGASVATVQRDIKKIMAYSTVSQLGLMVMAIGAGQPGSGMFHLSAHAYFKSLLFLTAGAFIHRFHTNDIWDIARHGGKSDKVAMAALAFGLLSLSGIFPFAGFFSKDAVLEALREQNLFYYGVGLFVSFLTAYYSFRLFFVLLFSKTNDHHQTHHENALLSFCKALPLATLAVTSLFVGFLGTGLGGHRLQHWLGAHASEPNMEIILTTSALIAAAAVIAFIAFRDPEKAERRLEDSRAPVTALLKNKFYIDEAYVFLVKRVGLGLAAMLDWFDRTVINGLMVNKTSYSIARLGRRLARLQSGSLQDYLSWGVSFAVFTLALFLTRM